MTNTTIDTKHECPACEGAGSWDVMMYLHWNGDSGWREERCERCEGHGWLYESEMTDEELAAMTDSKGRIYGDMTNDELSKYAYGINKALRGGELDNRRQETYLRKLQAIKLIDDARNSGQSTLDLPAENGGG